MGFPADVDEIVGRLFGAPNPRYEAFRRIPEENQQRIVDAALAEFAANDYRSVSTNVITKNAGISKGLLFHYFGDKLGLFLYLLEYVSRRLTVSIMESRDEWGSDNFFDFLYGMMFTKARIMLEYGPESQFLVRSIQMKLPEEAGGAIIRYISRAYDMFGDTWVNIDESTLKEGLDKEMVRRCITWICRGLTEEVLAEVRNSNIETVYEKMTPTMRECVDFMKTLFLK
jgi:AcrR family transcriptional regulator